MKKQFAPIFVLLASLLFTSLLKSQTLNNANKVESIIQLTRFIDWSNSTEFSATSKKLYIVCEREIKKKYTIKTKDDFRFKNWEIIYVEDLTSIKNKSVVFVTKEKQRQIPALIKLSLKKEILTIAESEKGFCSNGGMINLIEEKNRLRFEINYKIIRNKCLNISSKVLALAKIYDE